MTRRGLGPRRCFYSRCGKVFQPKRSSMLFCGISCSQTYVALVRNGSISDNRPRKVRRGLR